MLSITKEIRIFWYNSYSINYLDILPFIYGLKSVVNSPEFLLNKKEFIIDIWKHEEYYRK